MGGEGEAVSGAVTHPLVAWLDEELPENALERSLVVTTSRHAGASLRRALLRLRPGLLGVHFLTATGLARTVLQIRRFPQPQSPADPLLERELLRGCLGTGPVGQYAARFRGALHRLRSAISELQRAGWPAPREPLSPWGQEVWEIGQAYRARDRAGSRGRLMDLALEALSGEETRELPGRILVAGYPHRERDLELLLQRLEHLDVPVRVSPPTEERASLVTRYSAPDAAEDLRLAAGLCLRAAGEGVPLSAMVVAAPTLGPYVAHVRQAFEAEGVPFSAKAEGSLLGEPRGGLYRHLASLLCEDAPRASYVAVASSPLLRDPIGIKELDRFDRLSRDLSLEGNAASLRELMEVVPKEGRLLRFLSEVEAAARQTSGTAAEQAQRLDELARSLLAPPSDDRDALVQERIGECLESMANALEGSMEPEAFAGELHDLFARRGLPISSNGRGGVAVVEYRDVPSFPAAHVHLLGLSADLVPAAASGEVLDPSDRSRLGLPGRDEIKSLERDVLRRAMDHASRSLVLSRPRSGELGRPVNPSPWRDGLLEERSLDVSESREQAHPEARARRRVESGLCPQDLALAALSLGGARLRDLAAVAGPHAAGWKRARKLERFRAASLLHDGYVGPELGRRRAGLGLSVRDLEELGRCPQQFLFRRVMRLEPLPREPDPLRPRPDRLGTLIHSVLDELQQEFLSDLARPDPRRLEAAMVDRARELLRDRWALERGRLGPPLPVLHRLLQEQWSEALAGAIRADLEILEQENRIPVEIESDLKSILELSRPQGPTVSLEVSGRPDRLDRSADGKRSVLDFKTGRDPTALTEAKSVLAGRQLQLVLYGWMLEAGGGGPVQAEVRPLHPAALAESGPRLKVPSELIRGEHHDAVGETLALLVELLREGATVPNVDAGPCGLCDFRAACRRLHPPSAERVRRSELPEVRRYLALSGKSTRHPLLDPEEDA